MLYPITNRWTGTVQFTAEINCAEDAPTRIKIGLAVKWAYLRSADLNGADLNGAVLNGAVLSKYKVDGRIGLVDAGRPNGWSALGYVDKASQALRLQVGCRRFSITEGRAYWSDPNHPDGNNRREVLAALDYIEAVAHLRGWTGGTDDAQEAPPK